MAVLLASTARRHPQHPCDGQWLPELRRRLRTVEETDEKQPCELLLFGPSSSHQRKLFKYIYIFVNFKYERLSLVVYTLGSYFFIPQTGTVGVLNSYYNGSMDKMIWGHDLTPADPQSLEGQHDLTPSHSRVNMI